MRRQKRRGVCQERHQRITQQTQRHALSANQRPLRFSFSHMQLCWPDLIYNEAMLLFM